MDSKTRIKVSFDIYGERYSQEWYINYTPSWDDGPDERVSTWFKLMYDLALTKSRLKRLEDQL